MHHSINVETRERYIVKVSWNETSFIGLKFICSILNVLNNDREMKLQ